MTKARDIADFKFENIVDTGTEGTKVASGTTAQRGSTAGQFRFNSTTGLAEYYTGTAFKTIDSPPTITSVGNTNITDAQISSNYDLSITGTNFQSGATVKFIGNDGTEYPSATVTVNSSTSITARVPTTVTNANEPFDVLVANPSGLSNTLTDAFNVDSKPVWSTASGQVGGTIYENLAMTNTTLTATDPENDTISYSIQSGALPTGISLNSSTGVLSGTPTASITADTTSNFTVRATSGTNTTDRAFNIVVKNTNSGLHAGIATASMTGGLDWFASNTSYYGTQEESSYQFQADDLITQFQLRKSGTGTQDWWALVLEKTTTSATYVIIAGWKWQYTNSDASVITHLCSNATTTVTHSGLTMLSGNKFIIPSGATATNGTGNYYIGWVSKDGSGTGNIYADASTGGANAHISASDLATQLSLSNVMPDDLSSGTEILFTTTGSGDNVHINASGS